METNFTIKILPILVEIRLKLSSIMDFFQMLQERFKEFARDTEVIGTERVAEVNESADQLIATGHTDSATIAEYKDTLNESWADLLELIDTRTQMLAASWKLHRFFHDCKDLLGRILVSNFLIIKIKSNLDFSFYFF